MKGKAKRCFFCPFVGAFNLFRYIFNGEPVCLYCARRRGGV